MCLHGAGLWIMVGCACTCVWGCTRQFSICDLVRTYKCTCSDVCTLAWGRISFFCGVCMYLWICLRVFVCSYGASSRLRLFSSTTCTGWTEGAAAATVRPGPRGGCRFARTNGQPTPTPCACALATGALLDQRMPSISRHFSVWGEMCPTSFEPHATIVSRPVLPETRPRNFGPIFTGAGPSPGLGCCLTRSRGGGQMLPCVSLRRQQRRPRSRGRLGGRGH
jgi:hypothetical protein